MVLDTNDPATFTSVQDEGARRPVIREEESERGISKKGRRRKAREVERRKRPKGDGGKGREQRR